MNKQPTLERSQELVNKYGWGENSRYVYPPTNEKSLTQEEKAELQSARKLLQQYELKEIRRIQNHLKEIIDTPNQNV
jgi:hypothetical protein